jgi:hypothetical protein
MRQGQELAMLRAKRMTAMGNQNDALVQSLSAEISRKSTKVRAVVSEAYANDEQGPSLDFLRDVSAFV